MSDTGRVIANIIQMDDSVIKLRDAAATVEQATSAVERENSYLTPDRYQSPAAEVYRANYANATTKLLSTKDNLHTFAKNLQTSREMIAQAAGVTDQQIVDQKIRISELREDIADTEANIAGLEAEIETKKAEIQDRYNERNVELGLAGVATTGSYLSYVAGVGGLALCSTGIGCAVGWIGVVAGGIGFLGSGGAGAYEYFDSEGDVERLQNEIYELQDNINNEQQTIETYEDQLEELGVDTGNEPDMGLYYVPDSLDQISNPALVVA